MHHHQTYRLNLFVITPSSDSAMPSSPSDADMWRPKVLRPARIPDWGWTNASATSTDRREMADTSLTIITGEF